MIKVKTYLHGVFFYPLSLWLSINPWVSIPLRCFSKAFIRREHEANDLPWFVAEVRASQKKRFFTTCYSWCNHMCLPAERRNRRQHTLHRFWDSTLTAVRRCSAWSAKAFLLKAHPCSIEPLRSCKECLLLCRLEGARSGHGPPRRSPSFCCRLIAIPARTSIKGPGLCGSPPRSSR